MERVATISGGTATFLRDGCSVTLPIQVDEHGHLVVDLQEADRRIESMRLGAAATP